MDNYTKLKDQLENIAQFLDESTDIYEDSQIYMGGTDIYVGTASRIIDSILKLCKDIENKKEPFYTKEWLKEELTALKESCGE